MNMQSSRIIIESDEQLGQYRVLLAALRKTTRYQVVFLDEDTALYAFERAEFVADIMTAIESYDAERGSAEVAQ